MTEPRSASRVSVGSTAQRVTLFEDRAEVLRRARAAVNAGVTWVDIGGVGAAVDDPSVVASVIGPSGPRVLTTRVVRRVREEPAASPSEIAALEQVHRAAVRRRDLAERALQRAQGLEARAVALLHTWLQTALRVPRGAAPASEGSNGGDSGPGLAGWRAAYAALDRAATEALDGISAAERELRDAREDEARASARLQLALTVQPRHETLIEVQLESPRAEALEIELSYRTPCAVWRPEHHARLLPGPAKADKTDKAGTLELRTVATVWQRTGEEWRDVQLRFSTARPAQSAAAPLLTDDVLVLRRKAEVDRRTVVVEARDQAIAVAGLTRGVRAVEEMPGVEDGGEPLWFEAPRRATVPSDGQPCRVDIAEVTLGCEVELIVLPERTPAAHVRATATLTGATPLLAGPVRLFRGRELVGSGRTSFVARGEPFELGFGVDDGVRVRRQVDETRETTALIGTQKVSRTARLYLSNLSGSARRLVLTERVPVSEIEDVKIILTNPGGGKMDTEHGLLRFEVDLPARGTKELTFAYRIEAGAKVVLPS